MRLTRLNAGDFDRVVFHVEVAGDFDLLTRILLYLPCVVEEVSHWLTLWAAAHDERILSILERHDRAFEAVRHWLRLRRGGMLLSLRVKRDGAEAYGCGKQQGGDRREG